MLRVAEAMAAGERLSGRKIGRTAAAHFIFMDASAFRRHILVQRDAISEQCGKAGPLVPSALLTQECDRKVALQSTGYLSEFKITTEIVYAVPK